MQQLLSSLRTWSKKETVRVIALALVASGAGGFFALSHVSYGSVPCSLLNQATAIPTGYGAAFNLLSSAREQLLSVACNDTSATVEVGSGATNQYVYRYGYEWRNNQWNKITYSGDKLVGDTWYVGSANTTLNRSALALANTNYVVGYVCQYVNNAWKCGCRDSACAAPYWQLQEFASQNLNGLSVFSATGTLVLAYPSKYYGPPGTSLTLSGNAFAAKNNTINFGAHKITNVASTKGVSLPLTVPATATPGRKTITVSANGTTSNEIGFMVTTPGAQPPTITSVTPASGPTGTKITIKGTNFTPTGNYLITSFNKMENLPSADGKTITVTFNPFPNTPEWQKGGTAEGLGKVFDTRIYVMNTNGISNSSVLFKLSI